MNLNREEVTRKIQGLKKEAKNLGVKLILSSENIYEFYQDCIFYDGEIGSLKYKNFTISVEVTGNVKASLFNNHKAIVDIRGGKNDGAFYRKMNQYIENDSMLTEILEQSKNIKTPFKSDGFFIIISKSNEIKYNVFDEETQTFIDLNLSGVLGRNRDVIVAFDNISKIVKIVDDYITVKEQSEKIKGILEKNKCLIVCKKFNDIVTTIKIDLVKHDTYAIFKIYEGFNNPILLNNHPKYPAEIFNYLKYFSYDCITEGKFISEMSSLVPYITDQIKESYDFEEEFKSFILGDNNILIFGYNA